MFVYDTGKICVAAARRCGHTSMYGYFDLPIYSIGGIDTYYTWRDSESIRVIVLRNPYDRVTSAMKLFGGYKTIIENESNMEWFVDHTKPYLKTFLFDLIHRLILIRGVTESIVKKFDFYYIDFDELNQYISIDDRTVITNSKDSEKIYIENDIYSKEDLEAEYQLYLDLLQTKQKLTPEQWKELTT